MDAPGTESCRDACELGEGIFPKEARVGVDVVDGAAVDGDRSEQASVIGSAGEIGADATVLEKNGAASVAAFDTAVEIVPLIDPAERCRGLLEFIEGGYGFVLRNFSQESENAVENSTVGSGGDDEVRVFVLVGYSEPEAVVAQNGWWTQSGEGALHCWKYSENNGVAVWQAAHTAEGFSEHAVKAEEQLLLRRFEDGGIAEGENGIRERGELLRGGLVQGRVAQPCRGPGLGA